MARKSLSQAAFVERGYGQVEPNHLSAQLNGQIYAQLPAAADIEILENGQFAKYDYVNGVVDFDGAGDWMLVFNEVKVYRNFEGDADFAMIKDDYTARVYSPLGEMNGFYKSLDYTSIAKRPDEYEIDSTNDPFGRELGYKEKLMPEDTTMVPRLLGTRVGDIMTTNMVDETELEVGDELKIRAADGILCKAGDSEDTWQVVKVYIMPDFQRGVKLMRIK